MGFIFTSFPKLFSHSLLHTLSLYVSCRTENEFEMSTLLFPIKIKRKHPVLSELLWYCTYVFLLHADHPSEQGKGTCRSWVHSRFLHSCLFTMVILKKLLIMRFVHIHCVYLVIRLDQFQLMMGSEKNLLPRFQLPWRQIRHSTQILVDVISLRGYDENNKFEFFRV